eukprot:3994388-Amphidinium_carterae.1
MHLTIATWQSAFRECYASQARYLAHSGNEAWNPDKHLEYHRHLHVEGVCEHAANIEGAIQAAIERSCIISADTIICSSPFLYWVPVWNSILEDVGFARALTENFLHKSTKKVHNTTVAQLSIAFDIPLCMAVAFQVDELRV